jgi:tetratricopeptide (TPR) repeat protein
MTNQGLALAALDRGDAAIAQYERTLDKMPRGYYLGRELVLRIVEVERRRGQLVDAIARLDKRWPERSRGYFEWVTLGDLDGEVHDEAAALAAYKRAVAIAPTEVATQRKLIALLDKLQPAAALAQHEAAVRVAPGDVDLQVDLAKRYHPEQPAKALARLDALAQRMSANVEVRTTIAALYEQWDELGHAIREYEAIAALEPADPEHAITLGDAYWRAEEQDKAREAWRRLDRIGTPVALFRHGETLAMHREWEAAAAAYTKALVLDGTNADAWYGRARAYEATQRYHAAVADARRAVALIGYASQINGLRNRQLLVRILRREDRIDLDGALAKWRFAFERGDVIAGYLLATEHNTGRHDVLAKLHRLVPGDESLGLTLARSHVMRREFDQARQVLEQLARQTPARAEEIGRLIVQVERDRERAEREIRLEEEGQPNATDPPDLVGREHRYGMDIAVGADVHAGSGALLGVGVYRTHRVASAAATVTRLDWTKRNDPLGEIDALGVAYGLAFGIVDARKFEIAAGIAPRLELRYGNEGTGSWNRVALGGDAAIELLPRALPLKLGLRFAQSFTDAAKSSTLVLELGVETR